MNASYDSELDGFDVSTISMLLCLNIKKTRTELLSELHWFQGFVWPGWSMGDSIRMARLDDRMYCYKTLFSNSRCR